MGLNPGCMGDKLQKHIAQRCSAFISILTRESDRDVRNILSLHCSRTTQFLHRTMKLLPWLQDLLDNMNIGTRQEQTSYQR